MVKLNEALDFAVELHEKQARLVIYKNQEEYVCRKETISHLKRFLKAEEMRIFKGRLQLWKKATDIFVEVKGETVGIIPADLLENYLEIDR